MKKPLALIVGEDTYLNWVFDLTLQRDYATETLTDGKAAQIRLAQVAPEIIVLDLDPPALRGSEIVRQLQNDPRFRTTSFFVCTSDARQANRLREVAAIVLLKPLGICQFREIYGQFISGKRKIFAVGWEINRQPSVYTTVGS